MASLGQTTNEQSLQRMLDTDDPETKTQGIESWIAENNLDQSMSTALKKADVNSINDLCFLKVGDIQEFGKEMGLNTIQRRKFEKAVISLLHKNNPQQAHAAYAQPQQPVMDNYDQQGYIPQQPQKTYNQPQYYQSQMREPLYPNQPSYASIYTHLLIALINIMNVSL